MATTIETEVQQLYVAYFSRPGDAAGLAYWENVLATNPNGYQAISASFAASAEYKATYANMSNTQVVNTVYEHLFGHDADAAGLSYWTNLLNQNAITVDNVVTQIAGGAQGTDAVAYNGKVAVATVFTEHLDTQAEQQAYATAAGMKIAENYIAGIKDLNTAATARDPGNIDLTIASMVSAASNSDGPAQIVGVSHLEHVPPHVV